MKINREKLETENKLLKEKIDSIELDNSIDEYMEFRKKYEDVFEGLRNA